MNKDVILRRIECSRQIAAEELQDAIKKREWSCVTGRAGIEIGLILAAKIIREYPKGRRIRKSLL